MNNQPRSLIPQSDPSLAAARQRARRRRLARQALDANVHNPSTLNVHRLLSDAIDGGLTVGQLRHLLECVARGQNRAWV